MPLHPQARAFLDEFAASGTPMPWEAASLAEARYALTRLQAAPAELVPVGRVDEHIAATSAGDIRVRIFTPPGNGPFPAVVWLHGGGWVVGSIEEADTVCRHLCAKTGATIVCPEYRLAPEHRFPAAAEDCYAVTMWVASEGGLAETPPTAVAVAGESAGGNLAAAVALRSRDEGVPRLIFQLLIFPVVGLPEDNTDSYRDYSAGFFLTRAGMEWFTDQYARSPADRADPYFAPLHAPTLLRLPPALVITAECDPLRDEGEAYARRLKESGVDCTLKRYDGQIHAFFVMIDHFDAALAAVDYASRHLRAALRVCE